MNTNDALVQKGAQAAEILKKLYPDALCSLEYQGDPWKLLVMARLSAQCADERVNIVCRELFRAIPDAGAMANTPLDTIEKYIKSCGLYHSKAKSIKEFSEILVREYNGKIPDTMEDLLALPGVGRKIANLILGDIYHKGGIVADTHCIRICGRLGFYPESMKDPARVEKILEPLIPREMQSDFCHRIVHFGRAVCTARSPACEGCPMARICSHSMHTPGT